jgi:hypothetical protein
MSKKLNRSTVEPSKFISLERLKQIQKDHYMGENGHDYDAQAVDEMIMEKRSRQADKLNEEETKKWDEYAQYLRQCAEEL